jgi:hypothetical protein
MCGSTKAPAVVQDDPVADKAKADLQATQAANLGIAATRKRRQQNSLLTTGSAGSSAAANTLMGAAYGKASLGTGQGSSNGTLGG